MKQTRERYIRNHQPNNHYEVLGVPSSARTREIKQAYHQQSLATHPDKHPELGPEPFQKVNEACV